MVQIPNEHPIIVRNFRKGDVEELRKLFVLCNTGDGSPFQEILKSNLKDPISLICYSSFALGQYLLIPALANLQAGRTRAILGALLSFAGIALFILVRKYIRKAVMGFCEEAFRTDLKDVNEHYGEGNFWVAEEVRHLGSRSHIVGYVGLDYNSNSKAALEDKTRSTAELRRMGVSPHYRRRGIAGMLLRALIASAKAKSKDATLIEPKSGRLEGGCRRIVLSTSDFQQPAIALYRKYGWVAEKIVVSRPLGVLVAALKIHYLALSLDMET
ncbi:acyl-CoA N-acyltransferase [Ephemerocybe angulata]|uniref:Acyl-CoA N-acyltransferase n=1 Tax=Ephemerocybe angulata TaxID=980116 RepID=A0A8H6MAU3_9AGAR|nr:acyl-CoA N-acyltransferase [Tulosesus angulatus]KAF6758508.1 acyl-CoA N-acyltransferase [Tulosesus angulatus]